MLRLSNFTAGYEPFKVVKNISLEVGRQEIVSLVGPNGAGKTTILKGIVGIADIFEGTVSIDSIDITRKEPERIAQLGVVLVPDDRRLFPNMSCEENLELGAYLEEARRRYRDSLDVVYNLFPALKEKRKQLAKALSGGEQQMLAIARGIMARPKFLLVDEPSTGLSPKLVSSLLKTMEALSESGVSILFTEQNAYAALEHSHRSYLITRGEITLSGLSREMLLSKSLISQYFGRV
ncbi:MAG: ABC transporter ATP-binding protein [Nitrososphaerales archaeon]